jgi:crotonobetainyl-CoA:carnitine CoA-transferase CaiB-like acyl-CoA transferase
VLTVPEVLAHPHTLHRGMVAELGDYRGTGIALKLSRTPGSVRRPPPRFAEDSRDILREAGFTEKEIDALIEQGIVPLRPRPLND